MIARDIILEAYLKKNTESIMNHYVESGLSKPDPRNKWEYKILKMQEAKGKHYVEFGPSLAEGHYNFFHEQVLPRFLSVRDSQK